MNNLLELSNEQLTSSLSKMILSASGWRTVFALSGEEQDSTNKISVGFSGISLLIGKSFCDWFSKEFPQVEKPRIALACDTRPTGKTIADFVLRSVISCGFDIRYVGVASAPEVMAYARKLDGFIYISASHNPIGHKGIKFGLNDGGVIDGEKSKVLIENFKSLRNQSDASEIAKKLFSSCSQNLLDEVYKKYKDEYTEKDIKKLFNRFERLGAERSCTIEGTGLGLAITKNLVEMMGGKIIVQIRLFCHLLLGSVDLAISRPAGTIRNAGIDKANTAILGILGKIPSQIGNKIGLRLIIPRINVLLKGIGLTLHPEHGEDLGIKAQSGTAFELEGVGRVAVNLVAAEFVRDFNGLNFRTFERIKNIDVGGLRRHLNFARKQFLRSRTVVRHRSQRTDYGEVRNHHDNEQHTENNNKLFLFLNHIKNVFLSDFIGEKLFEKSFSPNLSSKTFRRI